MAKVQSPLLGYNHNVRHRGRLFHIQTEDSGVKHPHVITHLFVDGGRILKSIKRSYAEHVGSETMTESVRLLMKEQHKAMVVALRGGEFDELVDTTLRPAEEAAPPPTEAKPAKEEKPAKKAEPAKEAKPAEKAEPVEETERAKTDRARTPSTPAPSRAGTRSAPAPHASPKGPEGPDAPVGARAFGEPARASEDAPVAERAPIGDGSLPPEIEALLREDSAPPPTPPPAATTAGAPRESVSGRGKGGKRSPSVQELTLDFDALEHPSDMDKGGLHRHSDLPPPPKSLFAKQPHDGSYRSSPGSIAPEVTRVPASWASPARPPDERYAPARPAAIFGPPPTGAPTPSIFSEEVSSDRSLDEIILSYLAEDLEPSARE